MNGFENSIQNVKRKNKLNKIMELKKLGEKMPKQGTKEWKKKRVYTIGGSEVSALLGVNPWKKEIDLVKDKTNLSIPFRGRLATRWGNILENVTCRIMEILFNTKIEEINMLLGKLKGQSYSPDGVSVIDFFKNNIYYILWEFKAPFSRLPYKDIPKEYKSQVQYGLSIIKDADKSLFVSSIYRLCSLENLGINNKYNENLHYLDKKRKKKYEPEIPISLGIIIVYQSLENKEDFINKYTYFDDESESESELIIESDEELDNYNIAQCSESSDDELEFSSFLLEIDRMIIESPELSKRELNKNKIKNKNSIDAILSHICSNKCLINCEINNNDLFINSILKNKEMDLSKSSNNTIDRVFELIVDKHNIKTLFLEPLIIKENINKISYSFIQKENINNEELKEDEIKKIDILIKKYFCEQMKKNRIQLEKNKNEIIGVFPWKMFDCNIILEERDDLFLDLLKPKLERIMKIISEINNTSDLKEKEIIINKYYPSRRRVK